MEVRFSANMRDLERELKRLQGINQRAAGQMADAHKRAAQQTKNAWAGVDLTGSMARQMASVGPMLKSFAAMIAGVFAGREALAAAETWTRFTNSLRVAGLAGAQLGQVQEALYASAIKNGTAIEPLGQLYSRLSQSASALGAGQGQLLQFTNGITAALRVQGGSAADASGALMQLSQAMAGGIVRAEEFNSINEGARPILQAVANGSAKYAGDVAKLRAAMLDGKLTSKEFFDSFLAGSASLESQAAKAPLTVAASMTNLHTALTKYIGQTDAAYGVTERISQAIKWLADNIDTVKESLVIVGGVYAATFMPALMRSAAAMTLLAASTIRTTVATAAHTASTFASATALGRLGMMAGGATVAMGGLSTAMAFLGGPVGIAIMAIAATVAYLGVSSAEAALESEKLARSIDDMTKKREESAAAENKAAVAAGTMNKAQSDALERTARLTGQVDLLSTAYGRLALEAKRAAIEVAAQQWVKANTDFLAAKGKAEASRPQAARGESAQSRAKREAEWKASPEYQQAETAWKNRNWSLDQYAGVKKTDATTFGAKPSSAPAAKPSSGGAKPRDNSSRSEQAVEQADRAYREAVYAGATTADERHRYALEALAQDRDDQVDRLARQVHDKQITAASADKAKALIEQTYQQKVANANAARQEELDERARDIKAAEIDVANDRLRIEADDLSSRAQFARTLGEKHKFERLALARNQKADDAAFKQQQDQLALDRQKAGWTQAVIDRLRAEAEANREAQKRGQTTDLDRQQGKEAPRSMGGQIEDYAGSFGSINEQLGNIAKNGLDDLTNGLTDAIMGAKSLKEAFSDMAKAIIADLIRIAVRFVVLETIGMAFGVKGLGKASLGISKNAMGTNAFGGGLSMVGEKGPELVYMPRGSQVVPNNLLAGAMRSGSAAAQDSSGVVFNNYTTVNANDAVLTDWISKSIQKSQIESVAAAQKVIGRQSASAQQNRLVRG